jgi:hypothetical protein
MFNEPVGTRNGCACAVLLLTCLAAQAASQSDQQRQRAFKALPDWTGIWLPDDGVMDELGLTNAPEKGDVTFADTILHKQHPPYNEEWEAKYQSAQRAREARKTGSEPYLSKECGFYFPQVMESPWVFEALVTPEETALIFAGREVRHILTDGRPHPPMDELWATPWGDSIGRWQGQTLIVDTVTVQKDPGARVILSEAAHFTERLRRLAKDKFEDQITVDDPVALTHPWSVTIPYKRVTNLDRMIHGDCLANDRDQIIDGKVTITPAK